MKYKFWNIFYDFFMIYQVLITGCTERGFDDVGEPGRSSDNGQVDSTGLFTLVIVVIIINTG